MQEKIEINDYIRTKKGKIAKVSKISQVHCHPRTNGKYTTIIKPCIITSQKGNIPTEYIVKHSKNIIDLIEKDDYVNGCRIIMDLQASKKFYNSKDDFVTAIRYTFEESEIETIVTKEQFANVEYKVGV